MRAWHAVWALSMVLTASPLAAAADAPAIVLIGGNTPHKSGVHDGRAGVIALERDLRASPTFHGMRVRAYPDGWPDDPAAFADAKTVVWYFDGLEFHPLRDAKRRTRFAALMAQGVGLVALHQAGTVLPTDESEIELRKWLGAVRPGMTDRSIPEDAATVRFTHHAVTRGLRPLIYKDEFYPTLRFAQGGVTPVARASVRVEHAPQVAPTRRVVAWAYTRPGGGRSFGFTGLHNVAVLNQPELRQMLRNAIWWTAGGSVPRGGVASGTPVGGSR